MKKKLVVGIIVGVLVFCAGLYIRPISLEKLFPVIIPEECVEISGEYIVGTQKETNYFVFEKGSEEFEMLLTHFNDASYGRRIRNLLPRGIRYHKVAEDDFRWRVYFAFEDVEMSGGSTVSGKLLEFENWFGDLDIYFMGERYSCYKYGNQDEWLKEALDKIQ